MPASPARWQRGSASVDRVCEPRREARRPPGDCAHVGWKRRLHGCARAARRRCKRRLHLRHPGRRGHCAPMRIQLAIGRALLETGPRRCPRERSSRVNRRHYRTARSGSSTLCRAVPRRSSGRPPPCAHPRPAGVNGVYTGSLADDRMDVVSSRARRWRACPDRAQPRAATTRYAPPGRSGCKRRFQWRRLRHEMAHGMARARGPHDVVEALAAPTRAGPSSSLADRGEPARA